MVGRGGEGAVFEVSGSPASVAKVYHQPMAERRAMKVRAMASLADDAIRKFSAWPQSLLSNQQGRPVGFVMPRVSGHKEIHVLYGPKSRKDEFPEANYRFLVHTAANVTRAFAYLHERNCVVGDINHGGTLVSPQATTVLIDCDSFQYTNGTDRFLCEVGVPDFTPPELQGRSLANVVRTQNHDAFGLAVMIFHLLFMGRHPFAGRWRRPGDMPMEQAIKEFRFAFSKANPSSDFLPPPGAPLLDSVTPALAALFERAFLRNSSTNRPQAAEWLVALDELKANLSTCASNRSHVFSKSISACPWCAIERATGTILFYIPVGAGLGGIEGFNLRAVWAQIEAIPAPPPLPPLPQEGSVTAAPSSSVPTPPAVLSWANYRVPLLWIIAIATLVALPALGWWAVSGAIVAYLFVQNRLGETPELVAYNKQVDDLRARARFAEERWRGVRAKYGSGSQLNRFRERRAEFSQLRSQLERLPHERQEGIAELHRQRERAQLEKFLAQHYIRRAKIDGIADGRKATLASNGIETAADLTRHAIMAIPGFGPSLTSKLMDWRNKVSLMFRFDASQGIDPRDIAALDRALADKKRRLESSIAAAPNELRQLRDQVCNLQIAARNEVFSALHQLAQAQADLKAASSA